MRHIGFLLGDRTVPARLAASISIVFGFVALTGWAFKLHPLTSVVPGTAEMKANTGVGLILCGIALLILADGPSAALEKLAQALSMVVAMLGFATLAEYCFGWDLGIDELLARDSSSAYNVFRGRMSPFSAAALVTIAAALAAMPHDRL